MESSCGRDFQKGYETSLLREAPWKGKKRGRKFPLKRVSFRNPREKGLLCREEVLGGGRMRTGGGGGRAFRKFYQCKKAWGGGGGGGGVGDWQGPLLLDGGEKQAGVEELWCLSIGLGLFCALCWEEPCLSLPRVGRRLFLLDGRDFFSGRGGGRGKRSSLFYEGFLSFGWLCTREPTYSGGVTGGEGLAYPKRKNFGQRKKQEEGREAGGDFYYHPRGEKRRTVFRGLSRCQILEGGGELSPAVSRKIFLAEFE